MKNNIKQVQVGSIVRDNYGKFWEIVDFSTNFVLPVVKAVAHKTVWPKYLLTFEYTVIGSVNEQLVA